MMVLVVLNVHEVLGLQARISRPLLPASNVVRLAISAMVFIYTSHYNVQFT